jgi:hypothetical protein
MVYDQSLTQRLRRIVKRLNIILRMAPPVGQRKQVVEVQWRKGDLVYDGPRFGVAEASVSSALRETRRLTVAEGLR